MLLKKPNKKDSVQQQKLIEPFCDRDIPGLGVILAFPFVGPPLDGERKDSFDVIKRYNRVIVDEEILDKRGNTTVEEIEPRNGYVSSMREAISSPV